MNTTRKLQGEIDRTLKKIFEGISEFEITFSKIKSAPSQNQKEKHENDLKKEIKKLQRLREQVKIWITQNVVQNKAPLLEARKKIETEMERYKGYERESKTKDYSNAGLKRKSSQKGGKAGADPIADWINSTIDDLLSQSKSLEDEIKKLESKDVDDIDPDELEEDAMKIASLDERKDRHKEHVENLRKVLTKWQIHKITPAQMEHIQSMLEKYLEEEEVGEDDETSAAVLYADLNLDAIDEEVVDSFSETGTLSDDGSVNFDDYETSEKNSLSWSSATLASQDSQGEFGSDYFPSDSLTPNFEGDGYPHSPKETSQSSQNEYHPEEFKVTQTRHDHDIKPSQPTPVEKPVNAKVEHSYAHALEGTSRGAAVEAPQQVPEPAPSQGSSPSLSSILLQSMMFLPENESRSRQYKPRNPYNVPAVFPMTPASCFDDPQIFEKLDVDVLFFIFYYQQGSFQQYLAAKELKRRAWRYHKKYLTWFQRHEEPKEITPDYECGTYVYFDYETGWCQRKKTEFTFEYRYLEDKDLV